MKLSLNQQQRLNIKLRDLNHSDRFVAKFYATPEDVTVDEPCLTLTGVFLGVYSENTDYCMVEIDGQKGFEDSDLWVEKTEQE